ncbi:uncharacterized protein Ecym_6172 [Eremothecium cymbalariae DBVPG|uniref:Uncharacterized protein n=1 Tax=Eremothecium cymbalariae (strain CBS 270.75 / DBVPG 7215 / KCTC 17166 / NRRL Y-17582) TaxID=931890 RepID=G8JV78_ERECY|nr:hypothetical protein Ecym_6172 [Eremothecium cymbalariae DBVPG\
MVSLSSTKEVEKQSRKLPPQLQTVELAKNIKHLQRLRNPRAEVELGEGHTSMLFYVGNCVKPYDSDFYTACNCTKIDKVDEELIKDVYEEELDSVYSLDKRQYSPFSGPYYF